MEVLCTYVRKYVRTYAYRLIAYTELQQLLHAELWLNADSAVYGPGDANKQGSLHGQLFIVDYFTFRVVIITHISSILNGNVL